MWTLRISTLDTRHWIHSCAGYLSLGLNTAPPPRAPSRASPILIAATDTSSDREHHLKCAWIVNIGTHNTTHNTTQHKTHNINILAPYLDVIGQPLKINYWAREWMLCNPFYHAYLAIFDVFKIFWNMNMKFARCAVIRSCREGILTFLAGFYYLGYVRVCEAVVHPTCCKTMYLWYLTSTLFPSLYRENSLSTFEQMGILAFATFMPGL